MENLKEKIINYYWMCHYPNSDYNEFKKNWLNGENAEFIDGLMDIIEQPNDRTADSSPLDVKQIVITGKCWLCGDYTFLRCKKCGACWGCCVCEDYGYNENDDCGEC